MTNTNKGLRRLLAGTGAVALALAGTVATGQLASADPGPDQVAPTKTGSLTINKYAGGPLADDESLEDREQLDGVVFSATKVGILGDDDSCTAIDLRKIDDWAGIEALFDQPTNAGPVEIVDPFCAVPGDPLTATTVDGQAVFPNLDLAVYLVRETSPGENAIVSPVPDFFVAIPTSNGAAKDGWNYHVVADPKNQLMEGPSKTIRPNPDGLVVGGTVTWDISVPVPNLNNDETFETASVYDHLDGRLSYASSEVRIVGATPNPLVEGTHYTVDEDGVTWTFTEDGRELLDENMGGTIEIVLETTVNSVGNGVIENPGDTPENGYGSEFNGTTVPGTTDPFTYWGELKVKKVDDSTPVQNLEGAEFKVFDNAANDGTCAVSPPASGETAVGTSDTDGIVQWLMSPAVEDDPDTDDDESADAVYAGVLGLWILNSNTEETSPSKVYCLYETVVPSGHSADQTGKAVTITPGAPVSGVSDLTVINKKKDGPNLPLTGAQGTIAMSIGGLLLVGAGVAVALVSRRRNNAAA